jgi:hypothetical protein
VILGFPDEVGEEGIRDASCLIEPNPALPQGLPRLASTTVLCHRHRHRHRHRQRCFFFSAIAGLVFNITLAVT